MKSDKPSVNGQILKVGESCDIIFDRAILELGVKGVQTPDTKVVVQKVKNAHGEEQLSIHFLPMVG